MRTPDQPGQYWTVFILTVLASIVTVPLALLLLSIAFYPGPAPGILEFLGIIAAVVLAVLIAQHAVYVHGPRREAEKARRRAAGKSNCPFLKSRW